MKFDVLIRGALQKDGSYPAYYLVLIPVIIAIGLGVAMGVVSHYVLLAALAVMGLAYVVIFRSYVLAASALIAVKLIVDWYLNLYFVSDPLALLLLVIFYLIRPRDERWVEPRPLWLWVLFLVLPIPAVLQGDHRLSMLAFYYPNIFFGALMLFWLGMVVVRKTSHLRTLFHLLAVIGTLFAIHTIIEATTGTFLFNTPYINSYLAINNFVLTGSGGVARAGSFLQNPDWNGTFFAVMLFLPLGLFTETSSFLLKVLCLVETLLMLMALLFTYSSGAWVGALGGLVVFILLAGHRYYRILISVLMVFVGTIALTIFPAQVQLLLQHASTPGELSLRVGAWETAINIIKAFPLTGIGFGLYNYAQRSGPYMVPAQYLVLAHPHDSYLELGAMGGLPVLGVFLALLLFALWQAWRTWVHANASTRCLLCGGIAAVVALSVNSVSINGWTLPPLAAIGWLLLGATSTPFLKKGQGQEPLLGLADEEREK